MNGLVERQNRDTMKFIRAVHSEGLIWQDELYDFLLYKHTSVNQTTGKTPGELFFNRQLQNKIPSIFKRFEGQDDEVRDRDREIKEKGKEYADNNRRASSSSILPGDYVYVKNFSKENKLDTAFSPIIHKVVEKNGGDVLVKNCSNAKQYRRNIVHLKKAPIPVYSETKVGERSSGNEGDGEGLIEEEKVPVIRLKRKADDKWRVMDKANKISKVD
jgi:hypothetical protein